MSIMQNDIDRALEKLSRLFPCSHNSVSAEITRFSVHSADVFLFYAYSTGFTGSYHGFTAEEAVEKLIIGEKITGVEQYIRESLFNEKLKDLKERLRLRREARRADRLLLDENGGAA